MFLVSCVGEEGLSLVGECGYIGKLKESRDPLNGVVSSKDLVKRVWRGGVLLQFKDSGFRGPKVLFQVGHEVMKKIVVTHGVEEAGGEERGGEGKT